MRSIYVLASLLHVGFGIEADDFCWMGKTVDTKFDNTTVYCPMSKITTDKMVHNDDKRALEKIDVSCSIRLSKEGIFNQHCRRCTWKEKSQKMCRIIDKRTETYECCCKRKMCNKELYIDGLSGSKNVFEEKIGNGNSSHCVNSKWNGSAWTTIPKEKSCSVSSFGGCVMKYRLKEGGEVENLTMDCATDSDCNKTLNEGSVNCYSKILTNKTIETICCCNDTFCNAEEYRLRLFPLFMLRREKEEKAFMARMAHAKEMIPEELVVQTREYVYFKEYFDPIILIGTSLYGLFGIFIYRRWKPVKLELRPAPKKAKKKKEDKTYKTERERGDYPGERYKP